MATKKTKKKTKRSATAGEFQATFDAERAAQLTQVYAWLAADLADWQTSNEVGTEKSNNCPVVTELHNEACRKLYARQIDADAAAKIASDVLISNNRGSTFKLSDGKKLTFTAGEISALAELMMDDRFMALAPYSPLGAQEMW